MVPYSKGYSQANCENRNDSAFGIIKRAANIMIYEALMYCETYGPAFFLKPYKKN